MQLEVPREVNAVGGSRRSKKVNAVPREVRLQLEVPGEVRK